MLALILTALTAQAAPAGYQLTFQDDFDQLNPQVWTAETAKRDDAQQTQAAVTINNGKLQIRTATENQITTTGFVTTRDKVYSGFGYYEARINFHPAPGEWCAFWLQSSHVGVPLNDPANAGVEVDIVEHRLQTAKGQDISNIAAFNMHWDGYAKDHKHIGGFGQPPIAIPNQWHTFAVEWTPTSYTYYVDDKAYWTTNAPISHIDQDTRLTCEVKNHDWAGPIPPNGYDPKANVGMDVDWIRIWKKP